jgi:pimeloyl-ACP methyl ester carboxylesterase/predicted glycosyltransferase
MRALTPDMADTLVRDGVEIYYEVYENDGPTILFIPPSPITHSRIFKGQIPFLARHFRVVTLDGRGNGRSGRPIGREKHTRDENVADILAVIDTTASAEVILAAHCHANWWAVDIASGHPDLIAGLVSIDPGIPYLGRPQPHWIESGETWDVILENPTGWQLFNRDVIVSDLRRWVTFFFDAQLAEPHSTKQFEDAVEWALGTTGEILADSEEAQELDPPTRIQFFDQIHSLDLPVLVVHGDRDVCQHFDKGVDLAAATGGELLVIGGGGHLSLARDPVKVNLAIKQFIDSNWGGGAEMRTATWTRSLNRPKRALYLSSPIGLGHVRRDLAIVEELRKLEPELQVDWLAQDPVTRALESVGETIHPASEWLASESGHIASEASGHDLHCFQALRRMDEILVANFMVFQEVVEEGAYDLIIGDEAWEVDHFWHENPELKRGSHVWMTDFVGFIPMPDGGEHEAFLTADYNAEMIEHIARFPRIRDRAIFVGNPDDIYPETFGPDLPKIRDWTEEHFDFSGYITGFTPPNDDERAAIRHDLGFDPDEKVCLVTVGGSGVGQHLLERVIASYPIAKKAVPELRMIAVAGPRIDPESLPSHPGLEVFGYVDRLYRHLSVCDLAVVQGGLTTTMELTAAGRPFLYFPLRNHFEQNFHVRHRLGQYGAGTFMDYSTTDPDALADAIAGHVGSPVDYRPVETDGAARAARMIADLI